MKRNLCFAAAAALAATVVAGPAAAQMHHLHQVGPHTVVDRQHGRTTVYHSGRHGYDGRTYGYRHRAYGYHGRGYGHRAYYRGYRRHCWTTWYHHHPVRHCR